MRMLPNQSDRATRATQVSPEEMIEGFWSFEGILLQTSVKVISEYNATSFNFYQGLLMFDDLSSFVGKLLEIWLRSKCEKKAWQ